MLLEAIHPLTAPSQSAQTGNTVLPGDYHCLNVILSPSRDPPNTYQLIDVKDEVHVPQCYARGSIHTLSPSSPPNCKITRSLCSFFAAWIFCITENSRSSAVMLTWNNPSRKAFEAWATSHSATTTTGACHANLQQLERCWRAQELWLLTLPVMSQQTVLQDKIHTRSSLIIMVSLWTPIR